jgi:hypothetical protein
MNSASREVLDTAAVLIMDIEAHAARLARNVGLEAPELIDFITLALLERMMSREQRTQSNPPLATEIFHAATAVAATLEKENTLAPHHEVPDRKTYEASAAQIAAQLRAETNAAARQLHVAQEPFYREVLCQAVRQIGNENAGEPEEPDTSVQHEGGAKATAGG